MKISHRIAVSRPLATTAMHGRVVAPDSGPILWRDVRALTHDTVAGR